MAEKKEIAVRISGVKKMYKLGQIGGGTLQADLQSWWAKIRGKEDPNSIIGEGERIHGKTFMALNGIDLTVHKGEAIGIIGRNGAGKSTLLKILSRVTAPTYGEIDIYGRITSMLEVGTGFHPEMTGRENVYLNGAILGMTREEIDAKMDEIIEFSEVSDFIDTPVKRYSSGMFVKLAFSVAAHLDSEIMIMDEVLAVGDINFQQKCLRKMREVAAKEGKTVFYVSHNMSTVKTLCNRCIVMDKGKVIYDGEVNEAIRIYSSQSNVEQKNEYDVSNYKRESNLIGERIIKRIYVEKSEITMGQQLVFHLDIYSNSEIENELIRFVLMDRSGEPLATTYSEKFCLTDGLNNVVFSLNTESLAAGKYYLDLVLLDYEKETQVRQDKISGMLAFSIEETDFLYNMKWNHQYWGNMVLPTVHVVS
jgi:lipopolysaccharide transport system ATP-binding protein